MPNIPTMTPEEEESYRLFDIAATIAHDLTASLPEKVVAAGADPIDAAYALWGTFTRVLLQNGWTACDLSEEAHEAMQEIAEDEDLDDEPVTVQ